MQSSLVIHRLLLAVLLWFASTVLLWTPIPTALDWLTLVGYYALSAILLDLAVRFRARGLYALLTLTGIYGLLAALFIHPATALIDMPRTLFTRVMGAHSLMGLLALAVFFTPNKALGFRIGALITGAAWAIWAKWSPVELWGASEPSAPFLLIAAFVVGAGVVAIVAAQTARHDPPPDLRLSPLGWLIVSVISAVLLLFQSAQGRIDGVTAVIILTLASFGAAILWFQKRVKGATLYDAWQPPQTLIITAGLFSIGAVIGYLLPRTDPDGIEVLVGMFAAYGVIWMPAVSIVLGGRAFVKQARAFKL